jgi:CelD/BcsL family acetyltransferase involved in cellulose biosynthesis
MITGAVSDGVREVRVLEGPGILRELAADFETLATRCRAPVSARPLWLEAWIQSYPKYRPVAIGVHDREFGLTALALLAIRNDRFGAEIVALGHGASDQSRLYAVDAASAAELAVAVRKWLASLSRRWRLCLAQLPAGIELDAWARHFPYHLVRPGADSPVIRFGDDRSIGIYLSPNYRGQAKNKWNRLVKHGLDPSLRVLSSPAEIAAALPSVMAIAATRQEELTGRRKLDKPEHAGFFRNIVTLHAECGEVELMVLHVRGEIAAYALTFLDNGIARMWSSHYDPQWATYSLGHIVTRELVQRFAGSPAFEALDWMKGMEPYKLRSANHIEPAHSFHAWPTQAELAAARLSLWARKALIRTRDRFPALRQMQVSIRRRLADRSADHPAPVGES